MYDVTIIGAGVCAAFLACRLAQKRNPLSIKIIDKGKPLANRFCGSEIGQSCTCGQLCDRYFGFGGLGKSEGNSIIPMLLEENCIKKSAPEKRWNT